MKLIRIVLFLTTVSICQTTTAQEYTLKMATLLYKDQQYADAIEVYERVLLNKNNVVGKSRLAECYLKTNQLIEAEETYKDIVEDQKAKPEVIRQYAEVLMMNEKYNEAYKWFTTYSKQKPNDKVVANLLMNFDLIKDIEPVFPNTKLERWNHNTTANETYAVFFSNGMVYSSDRNVGQASLNQKTGWTGRNFLKLFYSEKNNANLYELPNILSSKMVEKEKNSCYATFTNNEQIAILSQNSNKADKDGMHNMQLYVSKAGSSGSWLDIEKLSFCDNKYNYTHPAISPDGQTLYFVSDKPGGQGGADIWMCTRQGDDWSKPINMGSMVNSITHEAFPFVASDGRLFFASKGHYGFGGYDLFVSTKDESGEWGHPINLGKPVNSSADDMSISFNKEMDKGIITSSRYHAGDDIIFFTLQKGPTASAR